MHARIGTRAVAGAAVALAATIMAVQPVAADCLICAPPADVTDEGVLARARAQMAELNQYVSSPPPCEVEVPRGNGSATEVHTGILRWRLTATEQETWDRIFGEEGTWFRLECYVPEIHTEYGDLRDVRMFPDVNPTNIANVAIDDALAAIPTQDVETSPDEPAMVGLATWFWVEGVPEQGVTATASVPDMTVTATASPGGVHYDFGDNTSLDCLGSGVAWSPGATSDCTHTYQRSGHYTVTSTILWTGTYTVNGSGPIPIARSLPRTDSFVLPVQEAQAINRSR